MLFAFRGVRLLQAVLAIACAAIGVGCVVVLRTALAEDQAWLLFPAAVMGLAFLFLFGVTLRLPTSFVAVGDDRTRIRFGGFTDVIVANRDITGARLANHRWWWGLGVRTNFADWGALTAAWGEVAELEFARPVRIWVIPRIWPLRVTKLRLGVRNPAKLVERFAPKTPAGRSGRRRNR